jgi:Leucine Rich repeat
VQSDVSPLLTAYPQLEYLQVRGNQGLSLGALQHDRLKSLVVETGGLSVNVVREVCNAQLPELEHLELWLGIEDYGGDTTVDDLQPILSGQLFPKLRYLGLRDSEIADEIAIALASAPVLEQIQVLDLSLGVLRDVGAEALIDNAAIAQLEKLDIHHHYVSEELVARLEELGIELDASDRQEEDEYDGESYFYVAVSE